MHQRPSVPGEAAPFGAAESAVEDPAAATRAPPGERVSWGERLRATPVTYSVIAICVALQLLAMRWGRGSDDVLWHMGANNGELVRQGQVYRLLACTLLHGGLLHLLMNMMVLLALSSLEVLLGWRRFLVLFAASGLAGSLATALYSPETLSVGASGAIWGVMMAAFGFRFAARHVLRGGNLGASLSTLALNVVISFLPGVDTTAHFGGGAAGFVLGGWVLRPAWSRGPRAHDPRDGKGPAATAAAGLAVLLMSASLAAAFAEGRPWRYAHAPETSSTRIGQTPLSVALPETLGSDVTHDSSGGIFTFGRNRLVPVVLAVEPVALDREQSPPSEELVDAAYQAMQQSPVEAGVKRTSLRLATLDGKRVIVEESLLQNERRVVRYDAFVPGYRVVLVFWRRAPDDVWPGIEEQIVSSLRAE